MAQAAAAGESWKIIPDGRVVELADGLQVAELPDEPGAAELPDGRGLEPSARGPAPRFRPAADFW